MGGPLGPPCRVSGVRRRGDAARERPAVRSQGPRGNRVQPRLPAVRQRAVGAICDLRRARGDRRADRDRGLPLPVPRRHGPRCSGAALVRLPHRGSAHPVRDLDRVGHGGSDRHRGRVRGRNPDPRRRGQRSRARPQRFCGAATGCLDSGHGRIGVPLRNAPAARQAGGPAQPVHGHPRRGRGRADRVPLAVPRPRHRGSGLLARRARRAPARALARRPRARVGKWQGRALADGRAAARTPPDAGRGAGADARPHAARARSPCRSGRSRASAAASPNSAAPRARASCESGRAPQRLRRRAQGPRTRSRVPPPGARRPAGRAGSR